MSANTVLTSLHTCYGMCSATVCLGPQQVSECVCVRALVPHHPRVPQRAGSLTSGWRWWGPNSRVLAMIPSSLVQDITGRTRAWRTPSLTPPFHVPLASPSSVCIPLLPPPSPTAVACSCVQMRLAQCRVTKCWSSNCIMKLSPIRKCPCFREAQYTHTYMWDRHCLH